MNVLDSIILDTLAAADEAMTFREIVEVVTVIHGFATNPDRVRRHLSSLVKYNMVRVTTVKRKFDDGPKTVYAYRVIA